MIVPTLKLISLTEMPSFLHLTSENVDYFVISSTTSLCLIVISTEIQGRGLAHHRAVMYMFPRRYVEPFPFLSLCHDLPSLNAAAYFVECLDPRVHIRALRRDLNAD